MSSARRTLAALCLVMLGGAGCGAGTRAETQWRLGAESPADSITVEHEGGRTTFDIHSAKGIGSATLTWTGGQRPQEAWACFHLHGLEDLRIDSGGTSFLVAVSSTDPPRVRQELTRAGEPVRQLVAGDPDWLRWRIETTAGRAPTPPERIWVELPPAMLQKCPSEVRLRWIDFYR